MQTFPRRATVMGLGRFGGGIGVTRFLASQGVKVVVTDLEKAEDLADSVAKIQDHIDAGRVELRLGGHHERDFVDTDMVVANVAVPKPWGNKFLNAARAAGVPITTEIALAIARLPEHTRDKTVAITGSAGKSTTTSMIHHALAELGKSRGERAIVGGNIGVSLLDAAAGIDDKTYIVLELSSAQLYWLEEARKAGGPALAPKVTVVTNLSPNHIDWHGELGHYQSSKQHLIAHQHPGDTCILGPDVAGWAKLTKASVAVVDPSKITMPLRLPGEHNRFNAAAAVLAVRALMPDADPKTIERSVAEFGGLVHRLQLVAEHEPKDAPRGRAIRFYNDSKSTTPESCLKAIEALQGMPGVRASNIHLIAGGYDKGSDLSPVANAAKGLGGLYAIGATGPRLVSLAGGADESHIDCATLESAVERALPRLKPGDCLLLSPACASWDQYVNFEARGDEFVALVHKAIG